MIGGYAGYDPGTFYIRVAASYSDLGGDSHRAHLGRRDHRNRPG